MRITQGYVSKSIMDFPFHQAYSLDDYNDDDSPSVFFGCYRYEDSKIINQHRQDKIIFWTGQDALDYNKNGFILNGATHVTAHPKVYALLKREYGDDWDFESITLVKPCTLLNTAQPQILGKKIYAYCPSSAPEYHGMAIIKQLQEAGYDIIVGDGSHTQANWFGAIANSYYQQAFIGLCLSEFAGGGGSIIEMGLRGMKVVTNVLNLPNCIPWNSIQDVTQAIEDQAKLIGQTRASVARYTWEALDHTHDWLEI